MDFIIATTNAGKAREISDYFGPEHTFKTLLDVKFDKDIVESGMTFAQNASIKAEAVRDSIMSGFDYIIADDSGLVIDALNGEPGVHSARFLGVDTPYEIKNKKILEMLEGVPNEKRTARFVCNIVCISITNQILTSQGTLEGLIANKAAGNNGFGYDPIFYLPDTKCTLAQLSLDEKNRISHRAAALCSLIATNNFNIKTKGR